MTYNCADVGAKVWLHWGNYNIPGVLEEGACFRSDEPFVGLHNGHGRGPDSHYWFVTNENISLREKPKPKQTGFSKFIKKVEAYA